MKIAFLIAAVIAVAGCATKPVPESRQQQVQLINQTGEYAYLRGAGGGPGGR